MPTFGTPSYGNYDEENRNEMGNTQRAAPGAKPSYAVGGGMTERPQNTFNGGMVSEEQAKNYVNQYGNTMPDRGRNSRTAQQAADNSMDRPEYRTTEDMTDGAIRETLQAHVKQGMQQGAKRRQNADAMIGKEKSERRTGGFEVKSNELNKPLSKSRGGDHDALDKVEPKSGLNTDEALSKGDAGISIRETYDRQGKARQHIYEARDGKVHYHGPDGQKVSGTPEEMRRFEIGKEKQIAKNTGDLLQTMKENPGLRVKQGDNMFHVDGDKFVRTDRDGKQTAMPVKDMEQKIAAKVEHLNGLEKQHGQGGEQRSGQGSTRPTFGTPSYGNALSDDKRAQVREAFQGMRQAGQRKPEPSASQQKDKGHEAG